MLTNGINPILAETDISLVDALNGVGAGLVLCAIALIFCGIAYLAKNKR